MSEELVVMFNDPKTIKVLASCNHTGEIHIEFCDQMYVHSDGYIYLFELIENSQQNKNILSALWFNKEVVASIHTRDGLSYQFTLLPYRAIISGTEFTKLYSWFQANIGNYDLSTVWVLNPTKIMETTISKQVEEQIQKFPMVNHLDRLLKE